MLDVSKLICECCGKNAALCVSRWACLACPDQHIVCLLCLSKASAMQGTESTSAFLTCPKNLVTAYELAPTDSPKVKITAQWTAWWDHAAS